jgi:ABC-type transport system involved in cytochrome c biogenesis permease subunit
VSVQYSILGLLIYLSLAGHVAGFALHLARRRRMAMILYDVAFALACSAFAVRWWNVGHVPVQNLFEVFLALGMLCRPISLVCRRILGIGAEGVDMLLAALLLFPVGFIFGPDPRPLPPALQTPLFVPHVASYVLAYVIMTKAAAQAGRVLLLARRDHVAAARAERSTHRMICLGFPLLTAGLLLGAVWGKLAWGDYWNWDPKEMWSLAVWLTYVGYFHFRALFAARHPRLNAAWALVGLALILITLLWVNLSRLFAGLHTYA